MEILIDLASEINSWGDFYMITTEECNDLVEEFHERLEMQDISSLVIVEDMEVDLNKDDALLAISKGGREDNIISMVKMALKNKVKAYGICTDFRSPLSMLCDESIIINENDDFDECLLRIFDCIIENLSIEAKDDNYDIQDSEYMYKKELNVLSRMNGVIVSINVNVGDEVKKGDVLFVMDAMKMENKFCADRDGVVVEIMVNPGDIVNVNDSILEIRERY